MSDVSAKSLRDDVAREFCRDLYKHIVSGDALDAAVEREWRRYTSKADAILPLVIERCAEAVRGERLCDPQPGTSDEAYMQALDDAEAAIRALPVPE